jgi:hypothetical protein
LSVLYLTSNSMEYNPSWEGNTFSVHQEIPTILRQRKAHSGLQKWLQLVALPSNINPVCDFKSYLFNIILILSSHVHVFIPNSLFRRALHVKPNMLLPSTPSVPYDFPSFPPWFSTPQSYLTRYTNHEYSRFVRICSIFLISFGPKIINQLVLIRWLIRWTSRQKKDDKVLGSH